MGKNKEMKINPKFQIEDTVQVGPYIGQIISISIHPNNGLTYNVSYWKNGEDYTISNFYEFELQKANSQIGFMRKE